MNGHLTPHRGSPPGLNAELWSRPEARIVLTYLILASAWIIGSDLLLTTAVFERDEIAVIQTLKGLNFIFTTAILLFFVLRRAYDGWRVAEEDRRVVIEQAREKFRTLCSHVQDLREEDRIRITREIHDDGKGINPSSITDPKSLGLMGMNERAENVGGQVVISQNLVKRTDVILTLPLPGFPADPPMKTRRSVNCWCSNSSRRESRSRKSAPTSL